MEVTNFFGVQILWLRCENDLLSHCASKRGCAFRLFTKALARRQLLAGVRHIIVSHSKNPSDTTIEYLSETTSTCITNDHLSLHL